MLKDKEQAPEPDKKPTADELMQQLIEMKKKLEESENMKNQMFAMVMNGQKKEEAPTEEPKTGEFADKIFSEMLKEKY